MENLIVLKESQLAEMIYETLCRCFDERNIGKLEKPVEHGFYERDELCEYGHISLTTLWRLEKAGVLNSVKVGRRKLYAKPRANSSSSSGLPSNAIPKYSMCWDFQ